MHSFQWYVSLRVDKKFNWQPQKGWNTKSIALLWRVVSPSTRVGSGEMQTGRKAKFWHLFLGILKSGISKCEPRSSILVPKVPWHWNFCIVFCHLGQETTISCVELRQTITTQRTELYCTVRQSTGRQTITMHCTMHSALLHCTSLWETGWMHCTSAAEIWASHCNLD